MMKVLFTTLLCALAILLPAQAQDPETPSVLPIIYDAEVTETITQNAIYDWWQIEALSGEQMVVDMWASDGLQPLLGLLDQSGTLILRSQDGAADGTVRIEFTIPQDGTYTIVATRVGNLQGTSIGSYFLTVRQANAPETGPDYQPVTFRCEDFEVETVATVVLEDDPIPEQSYRITLYGLDGLEPVLHIAFRNPQDDSTYEFCNTDAVRMSEDTFTLPGEEIRQVTPESLPNMSQITVNGVDEVGRVEIIIGSRNGSTGRYMLVMDTFSIATVDDVDVVEARIGPLAATRTLMHAYMVAVPGSRLDPFMEWGANGQRCDDAGRGDCRGIVSFAGAGFTINEGEDLFLIGDRSDAGLLLGPGTPDTMSLVLSSSGGRTYGNYALVVIGEMPPRE
jgi:hypothetical protein